MTSRPVIVGVGARTAVGLRAVTSAAAVRAGISRVQEHPFMVDRAGEFMRVAREPSVPADLFGPARLVAMGRPALLEAIEALPRGARPRIDVLVGLPEERPGWTAADAAATIRGLVRELPFDVGDVAHFPRGHAAGLIALDSAVERLQRGSTEWCLVGGVDSYLQADTLEWLDGTRQLANKRNRSGFFPGEGAGFCLLTTSSAARGLGRPPLAEVLAVATAIEPKRIKSDAVCIGEGLCQAIRAATQCIDPKGQRIATTYCDINGERYRTEEFFYVPLRVWAPFVDANAYQAPADCWGDVGAASGPLFATLAVASGQRGAAAGKHVLLWASSEAGHRSAATLALPG